MREHLLAKRANRYLNRKGPYWYAQVVVPVDLRKQLGPVIQRSLHTKDIVEARLRRDAVADEIRASFALAC